MDDLISRQAAIDAINHICPVYTEYDCTLLDRVDVRYVLSDLPSAEPKKGRWIEDDRGYFKCSVCGEKPKDQTSTTDYCPNCGATMEVSE